MDGARPDASILAAVYGRARKVAIGYFRGRPDPLDLAGEAAVRGWLKALEGTNQPDGSVPRRYLDRVVRSECRDTVRWATRLRRAGAVPIGSVPDPADPGSGDDIAAVDARDLAESVLARLPEPERTWALRVAAGETRDAVARSAGTTRKRIGKRLSLAGRGLADEPGGG